MSYWSYITGVITVSPMGRTQHEKTYILNTVLDHLPRVTGSEEDMYVHVVQQAGYNCSSNTDEFGNFCRRYEHFETQDQYMIVVEAHLRDRMFDETYRSFIKWLTRLSKRIMVKEILVSVSSYDKNVVINEDYGSFYDLFETPSWIAEDEPNWCEYLMWQSIPHSFYPAQLAYKYYDDPENDKRVEEWIYGTGE